MDHTGNAVSFVDYYKRAYDKTINDKEQPLLIHRPKKRDKLTKDGPDEVICLVPELCCRTGLTDYARSAVPSES
jgi:aubergine-like protein